MERSKKPSALSAPKAQAPAPHVEFSADNARVTASLPSGSSITVLLYGATVISWKNADGSENLWLSEKAILDGSKAVRGGIPLVFPVFGPPPKSGHPTSSLPQHGFARTSTWDFLGKTSSEAASNAPAAPASKASGGGDNSIQLDFGLSHTSLSDAAKKAWPFEFGLIYSVTLSEGALETAIQVRNEGGSAWEANWLMHTYLRINDISRTSITGLTTAFLSRTTSPHSNHPADTSPLRFKGEIDRTYAALPTSQPVAVLEGGKEKFSIERDNLEDVVVWNPWSEKAKGMADFAPADGYKNMGTFISLLAVSSTRYKTKRESGVPRHSRLELPTWIREGFLDLRPDPRIEFLEPSL
ncbi:MAG: hypothetical protein M1824_005204 [Vezdaea acicularis]|nr:MAG: hypothetical protein M1824_005204 [Vezdaea acicularis]